MKKLLFNGREKVLNPFKGNIFLMKVMGVDESKKTWSTSSKIPIRKQTRGTEIKTLTLKQVLQRLLIALT